MIGKIDHIVAHKDDHSTLWFAFYNANKRRAPQSFNYAKCEDFIGSKMKMIKCENKELVGQLLVGRRVCVFFVKFQQYYKGKISKYDKENSKAPYEVVFDDGDVFNYSEVKIVQSMRIE